MKKLIKLLPAVFLVLLSLSGCKKFLDLKPLDQGSVDNSFKNPDDANLALIGVYDVLQQGRTDFGLLTERTTDNAVNQPSQGGAAGAGDHRELIEYKFTSGNGFMENIWNISYRGIAAANQLITSIEGITFPNQALKNQYIGEAKFLRAYFYFNLLRFFGAVPLSLTEIKYPAEAFALKRSPEPEVYAAITADLIDATAKLPVAHSANNLGRGTQGAAKALLAKVYLTDKKPALALPLLRELSAAPYTYRLMANYNEVFSTDNTAESIFEIQFANDQVNAEGNPLPVFFFTNDATIGKDIYGAGYVGPVGGGWLLATPNLYNSYEAADARRAFNFLIYNSRAERINVNIVRKYYRLPATGLGGGDENVIVLRFADVLLMLAEAINETSGPTAEAYDAVDKVRVRAKVAAWPRTFTTDAFRVQLLEERRRELAFEFHRWFDLKRFGQLYTLLQAKGYAIQPFHVLFPIPKQQVDINPENTTQNPGY